MRSIDVTRVNYGDVESSGIDVDGSLQIERHWGCLQLDLGVTWVAEYRIRDMDAFLPVDRVGIANAQGTIPEWRAIGTLGWKFRTFGASTTATHYSFISRFGLNIRAPRSAHWLSDARGRAALGRIEPGRKCVVR